MDGTTKKEMVFVAGSAMAPKPDWSSESWTGWTTWKRKASSRGRRRCCTTERFDPWHARPLRQNRTGSHKIAQRIRLIVLCRSIIGEMVVSNCARRLAGRFFCHRQSRSQLFSIPTAIPMCRPSQQLKIAQTRHQRRISRIGQQPPDEADSFGQNEAI